VTRDKPQRPLPKWMFRVLNPVVKALLRSPLHGLISHDLMVLSFTGRKSGKQYAVPVGYLQKDNRLYFSCLAGWWQNLPGAPVMVRLRGQDRDGTAARIVDPEGITEVVQMLIAKRGEKVAKRIGLLAARTDAEAGKDAIFPATIARGATTWPALLPPVKRRTSTPPATSPP